MGDHDGRLDCPEGQLNRPDTPSSGLSPDNCTKRPLSTHCGRSLARRSPVHVRPSNSRWRFRVARAGRTHVLLRNVHALGLRVRSLAAGPQTTHRSHLGNISRVSALRPQSLGNRVDESESRRQSNAAGTALLDDPERQVSGAISRWLPQGGSDCGGSYAPSFEPLRIRTTRIRSHKRDPHGRRDVIHLPLARRHH